MSKPDRVGLPRLRKVCIAAAGMCMAFTATTAQALNFNFEFLSTSTGQANTAFMQAGSLWSSWITDSVTVNLLVGTATLDTGILASASSSEGLVPYSSFKSLLHLDASTSLDMTATASLPAGDSFPLRINRTSDNPFGSGSATPYLDNDNSSNNSNVLLTYANARALGFGTPAGLDGSISFSDQYSWDFDRSNGITAGQFDFVGIAAHEIGHTLGFISGIDYLDFFTNRYSSNDYDVVTSLDLFRYSAESTSLHALDWTADSRTKYFSVDGGTTALGSFSTGDHFGDGQQASHWKDNSGLGIMDPTAAYGEMLGISSLDLMAFDAIGWDLAPTPVPAPLPILGALSALAWSRKLRQRIRQASTEQAATQA